MKRYISIIIGILTSLSLSAATFPTEGFGSDVGYGEFGVEDYGSEEVGADIPIDNTYVPEDITITVALPEGGTMDINVYCWSDQAYNEGDIVTGTSFAPLVKLSSTAKTEVQGKPVTISYPGYLFAVDNSGNLLGATALGAGGFLFKMPLDDNLAVALMLILMAAGYGAVRMRRKRVEVA